MARRPLLDFLNGYEDADGRVGAKSGAGKSFFSRSYSGSITHSGSKNVFLMLTRVGDKFSHTLAFTSTKTYGAAFLSYGLACFLLYFLADYIEISGARLISSLIIGIASSLVSIPLLLLDKPMAHLLQENKAADFILFEFFCIKRVSGRENTKTFPSWLGAILGALLGAVGYFVPAYFVAVFVLVLLLVYITFLSPEFCLLLSLMAIPYLSYIPNSTTVFAISLTVGFVSFIRKVICGKRVVFFEQYDFLIALMLTFILISGIFIKGSESFTSSLIMVAMALGYVLAGNLITNRRIADSALGAVVISSLAPSLISLYTLISALSRGDFGSLVGRGVSSSFSSTDTAAAFFIVSILFSAALLKQSKGWGRVANFAVIVLNLIALLLTGEFFSVFALLLGALAYYILKTKSLALPLFILAFLIPYTVLFLPENIVDAVLAYVPGIDKISELKELWRATASAFSDNIFFGIGIGGESFAMEMGKYGIEGFLNSRNIFLEIGLEAGVGALICFALLLPVRIRHRVMYHSYIKHSQISTLAPFVSSALFALICYGATEYIWAEESVFYLFFAVFGIGSATLRIAKKEVDDKVLYYDDTRDVDSSAIDIEIR